MADIDFSAYDGLSIEEISQRMCEIKRNCRLDRVEDSRINYFEKDGRFIPVGLDCSPNIFYIGRNGEYGSMSFDEATEILRKEKELRVEKDLQAKGITRQDVRGFLEYIAMSVTLHKKVHPEMYEEGQ